MNRAATRLIAVIQDRQWRGAHIRIGPPGNRLALDVGAQVLPLEKAQLIVRREIFGRKSRPPLEANDFHACLA